jgi:hypothetical protein
MDCGGSQPLKEPPDSGVASEEYGKWTKPAAKKPPKSVMASKEYGSDQGVKIAKRCT